MKQDEIDKLMKKIDKCCKLPKHWNDFIEKQSKEHHIIIKDTANKEFYCTNCKNTFYNKEMKVKDYSECPNCKIKSVVYGINYSRTSFEKSVILVQRMNKQIIIRVFEIYSDFSDSDKNINRSVIEYARILPGIGRFFGSNVYINAYGFMRVYHGDKQIYWTKYKGYRDLTSFPTYPFNKKKLLKGTKLEYAPIDEFVKKFHSYNFLDGLEIASYDSFELLWKLKLYNLSFHSYKFNKKGSFYNRFGISKDYLEFMQEIDIDYRELKLLQLFQKKDQDLINKYRYQTFRYIKFLYDEKILEKYMNKKGYLHCDDIKILKEIKKYVPLKKYINYEVGFNNKYIYRDYLQMAEELGLNLKSNDDLYPDNLIEKHDELQKRLTVLEDRKAQFGVYLRYLELSKYTYQDDKYIIFPAPSVDDMKDESKQQDNCVAYRYMEPYIQRETEIYFIRELKNVTKSFITLEFCNGRVVQKELPNHNKNFSNEHLQFIDNWTGFRSFIDKKEKYKTKTKCIKYELSKLTA